MKLRVDYILSFRDPKERKKHISSIPKSVNEAYQKLIYRIDDNDKVLAFKIFSWVFHAKRPLYMDELREALAVEEGDKDIQPEDLTSSEDILECCHGLIVCKQSTIDSSDDSGSEYSSESNDDSNDDDEPGSAGDTAGSDKESDNGSWESISDSSDGSEYSDESNEVFDELSGDVVSFTHQTVKEFLHKSHSGQLLPPIEITRTCVRYLTFEEFERGPCQDKTALSARLDKYKFSRYAAEWWGDHAREEGEDTPDVQRHIFNLLQSENKKDSMLEIAWNSDRSVILAKKETLLHCLATNGLPTMCKLVLDGITEIGGYLSLRSKIMIIVIRKLPIRWWHSTSQM